MYLEFAPRVRLIFLFLYLSCALFWTSIRYPTQTPASVPFLKGKGCIPPTLFFIKKVRRDACGGEAGGYEPNFFYYNKKKNDKHPKGEAPLIKIVDFYKHPYIEARLGDLVIRGWAA